MKVKDTNNYICSCRLINAEYHDFSSDWTLTLELSNIYKPNEKCIITTNAYGIPSSIMSQKYKEWIEEN